MELFEQKKLPTPPSDSNREQNRRSSQYSSYDRDQTPTANTVCRLERSTSSYPFPQPPHLDRTISLPAGIPIHPLHPAQPLNPSNAHLPTQQPPYSPQIANPYPQPPYAPQAFPPPPPFPPNTAPFNPNPQPSYPHPMYPQSPLRTSQPSLNNPRDSNKLHYSSTSGASDSDIPDGTATKSRANQSKSRRRPSDSRGTRDSSRRRKGNSTVGTLAKVGGLATLLDGIIDFGGL